MTSRCAKKARAKAAKATPAKAAAAAVGQGKVLRVRAKYDAAGNSHDFRRHWAEADSLSPNAALTPAVMAILRKRARYEVANNSYAKGICDTLGSDVVGTGPRLQIPSGGDEKLDREDTRRVERLFAKWAKSVNLAEKLRLMRIARAASGECFCLFTNNPLVDHPVKLDLRLIEADQVASDFGMGAAAQGEVDGITYDEWGNPQTYSVLRAHPGSGSSDAFRSDAIAAAQVVHYFRADRPGQHRGIPDITPALPLFALLRRYTLASIVAAETAANLAMVAYTTAIAPDGDDEAASLSPFSTYDLERNSMTALPEGYQLGQVDAKHPTSTYDMVKREIIKEIGRCLSMTFAVAAGDSSGYNYSSGRLDHQTYDRSIEIDRQLIERVVLDRIFRAWLDEASLISGLLPQAFRRIVGVPEHTWMWKDRPHVDPSKEETARKMRFANRMTTAAAEHAKNGDDWEEVAEQQALEHERYASLGVRSPYEEPVSVSVAQTDEVVPLADEEEDS